MLFYCLYSLACLWLKQERKTKSYHDLKFEFLHQFIIYYIFDIWICRYLVAGNIQLQFLVRICFGIDDKRCSFMCSTYSSFSGFIKCLDLYVFIFAWSYLWYSLLKVQCTKICVCVHVNETIMCHNPCFERAVAEIYMFS